ncbi:MAG TPA: hypothetical protein VKQ30_05125 [Ktedonobacterales bacterium]|nr:hypothetical protein [Ktedonobacterales bacterium]
MNTSSVESPPARQQHVTTSYGAPNDSAWRPLYRTAGVAALLSVACIVVAVVVFLVNPPPSTVVGWFDLFHKNGLLGLLDLDLLMLVSYVLMGVIYLALYGTLRHVRQPLMSLATICGFVSITAYLSSNVAFNMLVLSSQYDAATTDAQRGQVLAAGRAMLATWQGSAFDVSYVLGGVAALIIATVMLRSRIFSRVTAYMGLAMGVLMVVPATAGTVGIYLSLLSLVPTTIWLILVSRRLFELSSGSQPSDAFITRDHHV